MAEVVDDGAGGPSTPPSAIGGGDVSVEGYGGAGPEAKGGTSYSPSNPGSSSNEVGGGAAPVEQEEEAVQGSSEPPPVPTNFLYAAFGDEERAEQNWHETLRWRKENHIDKILKTPQPNFKLIKKYYPWYYHRYDKKGNVCVYYRLGRLRLSRLQALGVDAEEVLRHNMFYQEYMWTVVMPRDIDKVTIIFDLKDLTFTDVSTEVLQLIKSALTVQSRHWPARTDKSFIVNAPTWFSYVFALIKPLLNQRQRDKVSILDEYTTLEGLREAIDEHNIPKEYGGTGEHSIGECEVEVRLWEYVTTMTVEEGGVQFREEEVVVVEKEEGGGEAVLGVKKADQGEEGPVKKEEVPDGGETITMSSIATWWFASAS